MRNLQYRTKGYYEYYGPYSYIAAKLQVRVWGLWITRARRSHCIDSQDPQRALQAVRTLRIELEDQYGLQSSLPRFV